MKKLTKLERFQDKVLSSYDVYNNVFLTLPFESINDTGKLLPIFSKPLTKNYMTSNKKVFAAGDLRRGQSLIVWAISNNFNRYKK